MQNDTNLSQDIYDIWIFVEDTYKMIPIKVHVSMIF